MKREENGEKEERMELIGKWNGKEYPIVVCASATVQDVKHCLEELTKVQPKRQKIMGLSLKGKTAPDDTPISALNIKQQHKFIMMGTVEEQITSIITAAADPSTVIDDFDYDYVPDGEEARHNVDARVKLNKIISSAQITLIHEPRPSKKLLVLDLDYTILDCKKISEEGVSLADYTRPFLQEFLSTCFKEYDIVVWSQTHWKWVEIKLTEMGLLTSDSYHISFVMDRSMMFPIVSNHGGKKREHEVKALEIIWAKFPNWNKTNTIHVDDLSRNFALNPKNGLKIPAFKNALQTRSTDRVLLRLAKYLALISSLPDLSALDHSNWVQYLLDHE